MLENYWITCLLMLLVTPFWFVPAVAGTLQVRVVGPDEQPIADVVVFVNQNGLANARAGQPVAAIIDQRNKRFVPHILVVPKGSTVEFPNNDVVAHHVYSFSKPNNFVLPLYRGITPDPVMLNHDGIVTLGCNIHDGMLAFIVVVDTDVFESTNRDGRVALTIDESANSYEVNIWSPRIRDAKRRLVKTVANGASGETVFALQKKLNPAHVHHLETVVWDEY